MATASTVRYTCRKITVVLSCTKYCEKVYGFGEKRNPPTYFIIRRKRERFTFGRMPFALSVHTSTTCFI